MLGLSQHIPLGGNAAYSSGSTEKGAAASLGWAGAARLFGVSKGLSDLCFQLSFGCWPEEGRWDSRPSGFGLPCII